MVESPSNAIAAGMAGKVDQEMQLKRIEDIAGKGSRDPGSLATDEVKALCDALLAHLGTTPSI